MKEKKNLFGEYKNQIGLFPNEYNETIKVEYKSFSPARLNEVFKKNILNDPEIYILVEEATKYLTISNENSKHIKHINFFLRMILKTEAIKSSAIEGTHTTFDEIILPESKVKPENKDDWNEVINYVLASMELQRKIKKIPVSIRLIKDLHKILLDGVRGQNKRPGEIRLTQNRIGGSSFKSATFVPPHPSEINSILDDLELFWHNPDIRLPLLIKIAIFHYQFETIHPFSDGNGRVGRLMILAQLLESELLSKPWFNISEVFAKNKTSYYDSLRAVSESGKIEYWIKFFLDSLIQASKSTSKKFSDFHLLQKESQEKIIPLGAKFSNANRLLELLYKNPNVTVNQVKEKLNVSFHVANSLVNDFKSLGILSQLDEKSKKRDREFVFAQYIKLFY